MVTPDKVVWFDAVQIFRHALADVKPNFPSRLDRHYCPEPGTHDFRRTPLNSTPRASGITAKKTPLAPTRL